MSGARIGGPAKEGKDLGLHCLVDSDFPTPGNSLESARSMLGYAIMWRGACIAHASRRQHSIAIDTMGAEIFAASAAVVELVLVRALLHELGELQLEATPLYSDNLSGVKVACDEGSVKRSAYAIRRVRFVQEAHAAGEICVRMRHIEGRLNANNGNK